MSAVLDQVLPVDLPLSAVVGRDLTLEDKARLQTTELGVKTHSLERIRAVHHQVARLLATGMKAVEVSALTGMSQSRISILQGDPAFKELLTFYTEREDVRFGQVQDRLILLGLDAAAELHERVTENPEEISTKNLIDILTSTLDRGGHGPESRTKNVHVHLSKQELEDIKRGLSGAAVFRADGDGAAASPDAIEGSVAKDEADGKQGKGEGV